MTAVLPGVMDVAPAPRKLRIVFAYSRLPLPMTRADQMTVAHLIAFLAARGHDVDFITLDDGEKISPEHLAWLEDRCRTVRIVPHGAMSQLVSTLAGLALGRPLQVGLFTSSRQIRAVRQALASADIGYCYYIRSAETMRGAGRSRARSDGAVTFLAMQLSQALNTRRMAAEYRNPLQKLILGRWSWRR